MKRLVLGGLSALLISAAFAPTVHAQETTSTASMMPMLEPFNLVFMGYQGYFKSEGIPSNAAFISASRHKTITAQDIVKGAIAQNRLPSTAMDDKGYLMAVERYLEALYQL